MRFMRARTKSGIEKIAGVNWRTTVSGAVAFIFALAAFIAASPSELDILPGGLYPYREKILAWAIFLAGIAKWWNLVAQKDAKVTGNGGPGTPFEVKEKDGNKMVVSALLTAMLLSGCAAPREDGKMKRYVYRWDDTEGRSLIEEVAD